MAIIEPILVQLCYLLAMLMRMRWQTVVAVRSNPVMVFASLFKGVNMNRGH
ncbi:MAG: hypothetical protein ACK4HB_07320 [Candidatus Bipolaricaulia bacterium]